jgi:radical SAM protein with 4Fe4S-binding SPASM domain
MRESFKPKEGVLTLQKVKAIMKRMPYASGVCIMGLCEPFLNAETPNILRWLKDQGDYGISFTTNGTVSFSDDRLDSLLRVDDMAISIDSPDPETFRRLRGGADLKKVMENFDRLIQFKRSRGLGRLDRPPVHVNAVITDLNFHQVPDLFKMFEPYADDLNYVMIDPVTRPDYSNFEDPFILQREKFEKHGAEYRRLAKQSPLKIVGFDWVFERSYGWADCNLSWNSMFIEPNGDVYFCYNYDYVVGNVFEGNPLKIWNSPKAKELRKKLLTSNPPLEQCHFCNFARSGWQPGGSYQRNPEDMKEQ